MTTAPDWVPDKALAALPETLRERVGNTLAHIRDAQPTAGDDIASAQVDLRSLTGLIAVSDYAAGVLMQQWPWFIDAARSGELATLPTRSQLEREAVDASRASDRATFQSRVRRMRHRMLLRILWTELVDDRPLAALLDAQSELADTIIRECVGWATREVEARFGQVVANGVAQPLIVIAMGKLGGQELNFSSDVDLIFAYPEEGESDGQKTISAHEYFTRIARQAGALLEEVTEEGFAYRVDTRLRPFGDSGAPVVSLGALEGYLTQHGRGWERYAYVKARVVCPANEALSDSVTELVQPFVYRRYLDYGVFESLREMKSLIAAEVRKRELADDLKLGPGGIREIEFIVQTLQLVRGGGVPALRTPSLASAIAAAVRSRDLDAGVAERLLEAYSLLRRAENWLQAARDQQTHRLPATDAERERLAFALGRPDWDALSTELEAHRDFVSEQFAAVALRTNEDADDNEDEFAALWARQADRPDWLSALSVHGVADADELAATIAEFAARPSTQRVDASAARRLRTFVPEMLRRVVARASPAILLHRILAIVEGIVRRSAYLALLNENPAALDRLVELCESSQFLAREIAQFPLLLDELIDARSFFEPPGVDEVRSDLEGRIRSAPPDDSERQVEILAEFKRAMLFRIAVSDFSGGIPIMKVSDRLTQIAELILSKALALAHSDMVRRFGEPCYFHKGHVRKAELGVIAYGKLGGMELSYGSDLDLVFLHDSRGDNQQTNGDKPLDNSMFFARLARRLVHFLTTQTGSGALYQIDTRLRPSGRSGLLVTSIDAFERYQEENAWTWEHQALLRSRAVAGSSIVAREFDRVRSRTLRLRVRREHLQSEVSGMRAKMRTQNDRSDADHFDIKQGAGGIADIEFIVQYLVLSGAEKHPALIHYPDNVRQLGTLAAAGILTEDQSRRLQDVYKAYRAETHRLALDRRDALVAASRFTEERALVTQIWEQVFDE